MTWDFNVKQLRRVGGMAIAALGFAGILGTVGLVALPPAHPVVTTFRPTASGQHCADLVAEALPSFAPVAGVWECMSTSLQTAFFPLTGDQVLAGTGPFLPPATYLGRDQNMYLYRLPLEASTAAQAGEDQTVLIVWVNNAGLVQHFRASHP